MFGVFCAGSSHVKNTRLKIAPKYEYTVVSPSFPCLQSPSAAVQACRGLSPGIIPEGDLAALNVLCSRL